MPFPPEATLADVGEFGLIAELTTVFSQGEQVLVVPGSSFYRPGAPEGNVLSFFSQIVGANTGGSATCAW